MKVCIIPPLKHMDYALKGEGDVLFALAHYVLADEKYAQFFIDNKDKHVIMDNGAAEGQELSYRQLQEAIKIISPDEVIAIDKLHDMEGTIEETSFTANLLKKDYPEIEVMGVPQGRNTMEWMNCYMKFVNDPNIDIIGFSKISIPTCFGQLAGSDDIHLARQKCVEWIQKMDLFEKPIHLLGMGDPNEYKAYKDIPHIRSTDSAYSMVAALNGQVFDNIGINKRHSTKEDYFKTKFTKAQLKKADYNIEYLKKVTHNG